MKRSPQIVSRATLTLAVVLGIVLLLAAVAVRTRRHSEPAAPAESQRQPSYWYDPMRPGEHFSQPGKSPFMDMQLVPKYPDPEPGAGSTPRAVGDPHGVAVDSAVVQNLGIRLATVQKTDISHIVHTVGAVGVDEHRIVVVQVRQAGWVEQLDVRSAGDPVRREQRLAGVYSPALLAMQQELLLARGAADPELVEAARQRLSLFGLSAGQIARIEKSGQVERRTGYFAPFDGYVMELGVREGAAVEPGATLFQLADLTSVWISAEVPEAQAAGIAAGDSVQATVPALPGTRFAGRVDYLYPTLSAATRTLKVRIVVKNPGLALRPGMFATVDISSPVHRQALTVPSEALIATGTRSVVILATDAGHFRPVSVRVGAEQAGRSEILEGLAGGQRVVASGQFLLDSEANLRGMLDHLAAPDEAR